MTTLATLCTTAPASGHGVSIGLGGNWKLAVQMAVPAGNNPGVWGYTVWGTAEWKDDWKWQDITDLVTGIHTLRGGGSPSAQPSTGTCDLTLSDEAHAGLFAPWNEGADPYPGEGTPIRVVLHNPVGGIWIPLFTGQIERSEEPALPEQALGDVRLPILRLVDPCADIAAATLPTTPTTVGSGDTVGARCARILTACAWRWPEEVSTSPIGGNTFDAVALQGNPLAMAQMTAYSNGHWFACTAEGAAAFYIWPQSRYDALAAGKLHPESSAVGYFTVFGERTDTLAGTGTTGAQVWPFSKLRVWRDDGETATDVRFTRAAGTIPQTFSGGARAGGERPYVRTDLLGQLDSETAGVAQDEWDRRNASIMRVQLEADITNADADSYSEKIVTMARCDLTNTVDVWREFAHSPATAGRVLRTFITQLEHNITPLRTGEVAWTVRINGCVTEHHAEGDPTWETTVPYPYGLP